MFDIYALPNRLALLRAKVNIGKNYKLLGRCRFFCQNGGRIMIGDNFTLVASAKVNPVGAGKGTVICAKNGGTIEIGNNVGMSHVEIICMNKIIVEDNVLIGGGGYLIDSDHHPLAYQDRMNNVKSEIKSAPIVIKEGAFIGAHSLILKGVTVGAHSVVGAGSVVTKSIPDGELWAGNPARFIRKI